MCANADTNTAYGYGYGKSNRYNVAIRNASAHETHDQFTGVMLIHGVFSSSVAWQRFEVVPNVIGPTSTTCERVVHQPAVVNYYVFCVFPSIVYNR